MQVVTPIVAFCPHLTAQDATKVLYPNPGEVVAIFTSPLESFLSPNPPEWHEHFDMDWNFSTHRIHRFEHCGRHNYLLGHPEDDALTSSTGNGPVKTSSTGNGPLKKSNSGNSSSSASSTKKSPSLGVLATRVEQGMPPNFTPTILPQPEALEKKNGTESAGEDDEEGQAVDRSKIGWPVYGMTASVLIEVASVAYQREPDFEVYAPDQMIDQEQITEWYNEKYGPSARL